VCMVNYLFSLLFPWPGYSDSPRHGIVMNGIDEGIGYRAIIYLSAERQMMVI